MPPLFQFTRHLMATLNTLFLFKIIVAAGSYVLIGKVLYMLSKQAYLSDQEFDGFIMIAPWILRMQAEKE